MLQQSDKAVPSFPVLRCCFITHLFTRPPPGFLQSILPCCRFHFVHYSDSFSKFLGGCLLYYLFVSFTIWPWPLNITFPIHYPLIGEMRGLFSVDSFFTLALNKRTVLQFCFSSFPGFSVHRTKHYALCKT